MIYRNDGPTDLTVDLSLSAQTPGGVAGRPQMLDVNPSHPHRAGRRHDATPPSPSTRTPATLGLYSGRLTATARDGHSSATTAVGFDKDLSNKLTIKATARDGKPPGRATVRRLEPGHQWYQLLLPAGEPLTARVPVRREYAVLSRCATTSPSAAPPRPS